MRCPYYTGAEYHLQITPGAGFPAPAIINVKVRVLEVFEPITISPVLKVALATEPLSTDLPPVLVLKVYDRRYAKDLRAFYDIPDPSAETEEAFRTWASSGPGSQRTLDEWERKRRADDELDIEPSTEETEAYLAALLASYHENEVHIYERMVSMQGNEIPRFFGRTRFIIETDKAQSDEITDAEVPGILVEYVEGTRLDNLSIDALSPALCQKCVDIVLAFGDRGVLNRDVRLENFIVPSSPEVSTSGSEIRRDVVMIDFAQARLRGEDEDDERWKGEKWSTDEEGAIGYVLQKKCGWDYKPTFRYLVPAED
ncbi:hypothetical protein GYMLUDRAFT_47757 [Collybiopsis luxurians FD-317 M1]|uniref:Protein kinase domain-containing protein n=1 Tax=Collybiopsis luxurians FD-317 M1 TaxID=944289 RepID=A0A0D0BZY5_9AGAR|nr:hypothetical protein GYMLUDRAFT_47757 [Collybiopsis luxurians FD-317 M1]